MLEADLRRLSVAQYGLVAVRQVYDLGATPDHVRHLVESGRWARWSPDVIGLVGVPPHERQPLMAAVLEGGQGTVACAQSAAALWQLPGFSFDGTPTVARSRQDGGRRLTLGRLMVMRHLVPDYTTVRNGIPVLTLPVLLYQLAGCERPGIVELAVDRTCNRSEGVLRAMHALLPVLGKQGRNGVTLIRELLAVRPLGVPLTASKMEKRMEQILDWFHEPPLTRQVDVGGHEWIGRVDFADLELRALFEVDSIEHHTSPLDRAHDAARDAALLAAGWRAVRRIYEEWIWHDPRRAALVVKNTRRELRGLPPIRF